MTKFLQPSFTFQRHKENMWIKKEFLLLDEDKQGATWATLLQSDGWRNPIIRPIRCQRPHICRNVFCNQNICPHNWTLGQFCTIVLYVVHMFMGCFYKTNLSSASFDVSTRGLHGQRPLDKIWAPWFFRNILTQNYWYIVAGHTI